MPPITWKANTYFSNHVAIVRSGFNDRFVNVAHTEHGNSKFMNHEEKLCRNLEEGKKTNCGFHSNPILFDFYRVK